MNNVNFAFPTVQSRETHDMQRIQ